MKKNTATFNRILLLTASPPLIALSRQLTLPFLIRV